MASVDTSGAIPQSTGDADLLAQRIEDLAAEAIAWTAGQISRLYGELPRTPGIMERHQTQQDLRYHIEFLTSSLLTAKPDYFRAYIRWLAGVLARRGVPQTTLAESLSLLLVFYEERLGYPACSAVQAILNAGLIALDEHLQPTGMFDGLAPSSMPGVEALTQSLLQGDTRAARALLATAGGGREYVKIATRLIQPSLYAIGALWERNQITVAQEHLATAIIQTVLTQLYLDAEFAPPVARKALFACVEDNEHSLGLRIVSDVFELSGWSLRYLGGNVPADALQAQVHE